MLSHCNLAVQKQATSLHMAIKRPMVHEMIQNWYGVVQTLELSTLKRVRNKEPSEKQFI